MHIWKLSTIFLPPEPKSGEGAKTQTHISLGPCQKKLYFFNILNKKAQEKRNPIARSLLAPGMDSFLIAEIKKNRVPCETAGPVKGESWRKWPLRVLISSMSTSSSRMKTSGQYLSDGNRAWGTRSLVIYLILNWWNQNLEKCLSGSLLLKNKIPSI